MTRTPRATPGTPTTHITLHDPTLRDGQHAVRHQLTSEQLRTYAEAADRAGVPVLEVGHGNGLGASSLQIGFAALRDQEMLEITRAALTSSKLAAFMLPGWGMMRDIRMAQSCGVDLIRIGTHCTEASAAERYLGEARTLGIEAHGVLLMSHMATPELLAVQAKQLVQYGAQAVGIFDSSGTYLPQDVSARIAAIVAAVDVPVIFHGHNNLGMAIANSVAAAESGATILDACARGFGAGAGNTQLEALQPVLERLGYETGIDLYALLDAADIAEQHLMTTPPTISSISIVSGLAGVFSGFRTRVSRISAEYAVDPRDVFFELGRLQVVAGQDDLIVDVAQQLQERTTDDA